MNILNLNNILQEELLTEDRVSKIQSKIKKIIMVSKPNVNWNEVVTNHNGNEMPYIQLVLNTFVASMFGYGFSDANMELAPHAAQIAFNELDFISDETSQDIKNLKKIIKLVSNQMQENQEVLNNFNNSSYSDLVEQYSDILSQQDALSREKSQQVATIDGYNGYDIQAIDYYSDSKNYYKYTQNLRTPWCLTHMQDMFNSYGNNGRDKIYFALHKGFENVEPTPGNTPSWNVPKQGEAPYDEWGYSMICIIVDTEGNLTYCTPRWNHEYGHTDDFLNEEEISQLIGADFYSVFTPYSDEEIEERKNSDEFDEEDWRDYLLFTPIGYECGYLKDGTLYDMYREIVSEEGIYHNYLAVIGDGGGVLYRRDGTYDFYQIHRDGTWVRDSQAVTHFDTVMNYYEEESGIAIGMEGKYFVVLCLSNGYTNYARGYNDYEVVDEDYGIILAQDTEGLYNILSVNAEDMLLATDVSYGYDIEIDDYGNNILFYRELKDGTLHRYKCECDIYGHYKEEEISLEDEEDEEELEPSMSNESASSKKNILTEFQRLTNKLDEIHKRNIPLIF